MLAQIEAFNVDSIIFDLGSNVNILTKQKWDTMGKPQLAWSPVQLRLANQSKVTPIGRVYQLPVEIEGLKYYIDFDVIEIVDNTSPYPLLLGINWEIDSLVVINLKKQTISFENREMRVIAPLDPAEEKRYVELASAYCQCIH